jgi:hypothetical protein
MRRAVKLAVPEIAQPASGLVSEIRIGHPSHEEPGTRNQDRVPPPLLGRLEQHAVIDPHVAAGWFDGRHHADETVVDGFLRRGQSGE